MHRNVRMGVETVVPGHSPERGWRKGSRTSELLGRRNSGQNIRLSWS